MSLIARAWSQLRREWVWVPFLLAALSVLFFGEFLSPDAGRYLGGEDVPGQLAPMLRLALDEVRAGRLPLWNPYLASGLPLWANPQLGLLYPPNWLLLILPLNVGLGWIIAWHVFWAGMGMYVWARGQAIGSGGALFAALAFAFSGFVIVRAIDGHPNFIATLSWLPWCMAALEHSLKTRSLTSALLLGIALAFAIYAGNPAGAFLIAALASGWTLAEMIGPRDPALSGWQRWIEPMRPLLLGGLVAAGLSAAQLLPAAELIVLSARGSSQAYEFASQYHLPLAHLITMLVPDFFGEPVALGYWGQWRHTEMVVYAGLLTLVLAGAAGAFGWQTRKVRLWWLVAIIGLILALGPAGGLHYLAYRLIPGFSLVRAPVRFIAWWLLAIASLTGWALDQMAHCRRSWGKLSTVIAWSSLPLAMSVVAFGLYTLGPGDDARAYHIGAGLLRLSLFAGLAGLLVTQRAQFSAPLFTTLALGLLLIDLWGYGLRERRLIDDAMLQEPTWPQAASLIASSPDPAPPRALTWGVTLFQQDVGMDVGVANAGAYDPLIPADYQRFIDSVPDPRATTFDLLSADYLLIPPDHAWRDDASLELLGQAGNYALYRRLNTLPRAWIVATARPVANLAEALAAIHAPDFDPRAEAVLTNASCSAGSGGTARLTSFSPSQVELTAEGSGLLVLSEAWYPGWRALLNGQPAAVLRADGVLRGVCLPAAQGPHRLVIVFDPPLVKAGLGITLVSVMLVVLALVVRARRRSITQPFSQPA